VTDAVGLAGREQLDGETALVVGSRGEAATFPYGYFTWWTLDPTGVFRRQV
jgi:hypothetical protein